MYLALFQFNPTVGAVTENAARLLVAAQKAADAGAELLFSPELSLCGYPPKDLVFLPDFLNACRRALQRIAQEVQIPTIVGAPSESFNAAFWCFGGEVRRVARKRLLPNYQVFDEKRYFKAEPGDDFNGFEYQGLKFGVSICEDAWNDELFWPERLYVEDPIQDLVQKHSADILVNLTASPFETGKTDEREHMFIHLAKRYQKHLLVCGQVGANDGLIFDGGSLVVLPSGEVMSRGRAFKEELLLCKL